ncbi:MAG: hypothetical protein LBS70_07535 [Candidatus Accumulibacter sp.]|jgi:hypothetical protein|nr:hypothetical protein [Accumulibacter sp.]
MKVSPPRRNAGAALLVLLLAVTLALSAVLISALAGNDPELERRRKTLETMARAKQALIAWSAMQGDMWPPTKLVDAKDANGNVIKEADGKHNVKVETPTYMRPGTLPCPDTLDPAEAKSGEAQGTCSAASKSSIGRLPWKTLGTENLADAHGETLWYAVGNNFRNVNPNSAAINSDTKGTLLLYAADGATLLTPPGEELAAVIFAPGPPLPGQDRAAAPKSAAAYLEAFNGKNNAAAAGPFFAGPARDAAGQLVSNDLVIGIGARELIAAIERRALQEAENALAQFAALPNPAARNGPNCTSGISNVQSVALCASDATVCSGRLPEDAVEPYVPRWFIQNGWGRSLIYAIRDAAAGCAAPLEVDGKPADYVLIAPGAARQGQTRPSATLSDYLEDAENADGWSGNVSFISPGANGNDQLRAKP